MIRWFSKPRQAHGRRTAWARPHIQPALEGLEDRVVPSGTAVQTVAPPIVTSAVASGPTANSLSTIQLTFSQSIVPSTFATSDLTLLGPNVHVTINSVTPVAGTNDKTYSIAFANLTTPATYTLYVGSDAKNAEGISLTTYHTAFTITKATTPAPPATPPTPTPTPVVNPSHFTGTLTPGQSLLSPNGAFRLWLQSNGNLVEYNSAGTPLWSSGTAGQAVTEMAMQSDGNLVLYNGSKAIWSTATAGHSNASLDLQNNGNLVIYSGKTVIWSAVLTIQANGVLLPGQSLPSPNGLFMLALQPDGNLVEYNSTGTPLWESGTNGQTVTRMVMQSDGNLVLYNGTTPVWFTNTSAKAGSYLTIQNLGDTAIYSGSTQIWTAALSLQTNSALLPGQCLASPNGQYYLAVQTDGNLVEYNANGTALWSSGTTGKAATALIMQSDGNLVLYSDSTPIWSTGTDGNTGATLELQNDGTLEVVADAAAVWTPPTL